MATIYKIGLSFEFDPDGEHDFLFEGMNEAQIKKYACDMVAEDLGRYFYSGEIERMFTIEILEKEEN
jgi:hypothetical protein